MCEHLMGNKSRNVQRGRYSWGIGVYFRNSLQKYIKVVEKHQTGIVCVELSKERFNLKEHVFNWCTYIPTNQSTAIDHDNFRFFLKN